MGFGLESLSPQNGVRLLKSLPGLQVLGSYNRRDLGPDALATVRGISGDETATDQG